MQAIKLDQVLLFHVKTPRANSFGLKTFYTQQLNAGSWNSLPCTLRNINMKQTFNAILKKRIWDQLSSQQQKLYIYY